MIDKLVILCFALFQTGSESSVDRLMKQISSFMSEISDEFKIVVVQAIQSLCLKYPRKHGVMMNFLSQMLRDEGGFDYKRAIVDSVITIIEDNSEAKEAGLAHLCEFIEDCEHTVLATRILHLLGREGPRTPTPSKYIRFIYNRVILENAAVRAAAVTAMAKFGAHCDELLDSCVVLLERCLLDSDDEVRDRATFYVCVLKERQKALNSAYILNGLLLLRVEKNFQFLYHIFNKEIQLLTGIILYSCVIIYIVLQVCHISISDDLVKSTLDVNVLKYYSKRMLKTPTQQLLMVPSCVLQVCRCQWWVWSGHCTSTPWSPRTNPSTSSPYPWPPSPSPSRGPPSLVSHSGTDVFMYFLLC